MMNSDLQCMWVTFLIVEPNYSRHMCHLKEVGPFLAQSESRCNPLVVTLHLMSGGRERGDVAGPHALFYLVWKSSLLKDVPIPF